ncbi:hypothetical protein [Flavobacterium sp. N502540]|uniref:hypothetical protein n=1 Tax=Flavobacterium sp. N502540 TaxID=2986838 RepID=UPI002224BE65|nr:hypothetical protein [Flavobacterium sp. N502540]
MSQKNNGAETKDIIIENAAQLWTFLKQSGGIDIKYYDKEIFNSKDTDLNLYSLLGIGSNHGSIEENLAAGGVGLETFLQVLLQAFHPYSLMMVEICAFFEKYEAKYAKENIKIKFDFGQQSGNIGFDLQNFRERLKQFQIMERQVTVYEITINQLSGLYAIFKQEGRPAIEDASARGWIEAYRPDGREAFFNKPDIDAPVTGHDDLDHYLAILMDIWRSFVNSCRKYGKTLTELKNSSLSNGGFDRDRNVLEDQELLRQVALDHWPAFFLERLFGTIQEIQKMQEIQRNMRFVGLCAELRKFISTLNKNIATIAEEKLVEELLNILSLPLWKHRYELYATWILARIDRAFDGCEVELHHKEGILALSFKDTHIATIKTRDDVLELWSEVRSLLANPSSAKRKAAIQPDYRILPAGTLSSPERHIAAIEVKQHKSTSRRNFMEALNDYAAALPNALVVLVNYGPVSKNMPLAFPERSIYMGQIMPDGDNAYKLTEQLSALIAKPNQGKGAAKDNLDSREQALFYAQEIEAVYVDVSGSLNTPQYKMFLEAMLYRLVGPVGVKKIAAVDTELRKEWENPDLGSLAELTAMQFKGDTDFKELLPDESKKTLVITDPQGYTRCVKKALTAGCCLIYDKGKTKFLKIE